MLDDLRQYQVNGDKNMIEKDIIMGFNLNVAVADLCTVSLISIASGKTPLQVVPSFNLSQYAGRWYEFARLPNSFQDKEGKRCDFVTAEYTLRNDGKIGVVNSCRWENGETKVVKGVGRVADKQTNSRLEVNFGPEFLGFLPFLWGSYNIIELAPDYSHALVGSSDRKCFWILSRERHLIEVIYKLLLEKAAEQGFDISLVRKTKQIE
ncbi:Lipocalin-like domain protein [uncultured archaeon]|nr:Lipocalin-like domain protein [uncultured archaeon]